MTHHEVLKVIHGVVYMSVSLYQTSEHPYIQFQPLYMLIQLVEYESTNRYYWVFNNFAIDCMYSLQIVKGELFKIEERYLHLSMLESTAFFWIFSPLANKKTLKDLFQTSFYEQWRLKVLEHRVLPKESMIWRADVVEAKANVSWGKRKATTAVAKNFQRIYWSGHQFILS